MPKDPIIESHIAQSRAKIEKTAPDTAAAKHCIDRTQKALERSRKLLEAIRDPLQIARRLGGMASRAVAPRASADPAQPRSNKAKAKRRSG
jgi:hypothetical protein